MNRITSISQAKRASADVKTLADTVNKRKLKLDLMQQEVEVGKDVGDKELEKVYRGIVKTRERNGYTSVR